MTSSIEHMLTESVSTKRLALVGSTNKKSFQTKLSSLSCHIQPLDGAETADIQGGFGKDYMMFCETDDVKEGDRVMRTVESETLEYRVTAIEKYDFKGESHMEVTIRTFQK